ncbi:MAG: SusC/RagA family TonB-linked outer membrane protein, partial [Candidatus Cryptobacteroides sp.]
KVDQTIGKRIKAGLNVAYSNTNMKQFNSSESSNYSNIFNYAQNMPPIFPIYKYDLETGERLYDKDGSTLYDWGETRPAATNTNAYGQLMTSKYNTIRDNISTRGYVDINILKDLKISINAAYDVFNTKTERYMTPVGGDAKEVGGRGTQIVSRYTAINANQLISYTPTFGEHSLNILVGHETKSDNSYSMNGSMTKFVNQSVSDFNNALVYDGLYSSSSSYFLEGVFARAEYDYASRYFLSASYRMDGSSRFAPKNRWGSFWAVGGSWNIKQENFLRDSDAVNLLKIKASYGTQGNDNIGYTVVYQDLYDIIRVDGEASLTKVFRAAPDVTWEKSNNFNVGFESRFWNRLTVNADFFIKKTKDMIYLRPLAPSQGDPSEQLVNDMDMQNTGVEFEISADVVKTKNIVWNISLNGTHYKNAITKLPADKPQDGYQTGNYWREVGGPVYQFNLREYAGVDPETGLPQYNKYDDEGNVTLVNKVSEATLRKTGKSPVPDLYGGFSTSLNLYGFDLSASFAYQIGGYVIDSGYMSLMGGGDISDNWHKDIFNRWTPENTSTDVPRVELGNSEIAQTSTRFLTKASYLSLRNVTIGYSLPSKLLERAKINTVRFYLTGDNLWYLSARRGLDVRQSFDGTIGYNYSAIRTVSFGVNLVF